MNLNIKKFLFVVMVLCFSGSQIHSQTYNSWPRLPGFGPESPVALTNQRVFFGVMGAAVLSYSLAEFVFKDDENLNFYQARIGMNREHFWGLKNVYQQNFGVENRVAPWFAFAAEFNLQQWNDNTAGLESKDKFGIGAGIMTYYRWYLFGKKRISPYLEYGTGLFYGGKDFPYNGTNFTFNHSTQLGIEYTFKDNNRLRVGYGQYHQSNNGLVQPNPGYDGNGFSISYAWFWKTSKW